MWANYVGITAILIAIVLAFFYVTVRTSKGK